MAGRLNPAASARALERLARNLALLPILPAAQVERFASGARLLAPFEDCKAIAFEVWHDPEGARLRLCAQGAELEIEFADVSSGEDGEIDEAPPIR